MRQPTVASQMTQPWVARLRDLPRKRSRPILLFASPTVSRNIGQTACHELEIRWRLVSDVVIVPFSLSLTTCQRCSNCFVFQSLEEHPLFYAVGNFEASLLFAGRPSCSRDFLVQIWKCVNMSRWKTKVDILEKQVTIWCGIAVIHASYIPSVSVFLNAVVCSCSIAAI